MYNSFWKQSINLPVHVVHTPPLGLFITSLAGSSVKMRPKINSLTLTSPGGIHGRYFRVEKLRGYNGTIVAPPAPDNRSRELSHARKLYLPLRACQGFRDLSLRCYFTDWSPKLSYTHIMVSAHSRPTFDQLFPFKILAKHGYSMHTRTQVPM